MSYISIITNTSGCLALKKINKILFNYLYIRNNYGKGMLEFLEFQKIVNRRQNVVKLSNEKNFIAICGTVIELLHAGVTDRFVQLQLEASQNDSVEVWINNIYRVDK
jgi:hypothetical protein